MIEYKVRPVVRYVVTRYENVQNANGTFDGSCGTIGEYPNEETADRVATLMAAAECPEPPAAFAVVGKNVYTPENIVLFAYSQEEAEQRKSEAEAQYGKEFAIFRQ